MTIHAKTAGVLKLVRRIRRFNGTSWDEIEKVHAKDAGGVLKEIFSTITLNITSDQQEYNIYTSAGSPSGPVTVLVNIDAGVHVYSGDVANPALDTGTGWDTRAQIIVQNNGFIHGMGGAGGAGGNVTGATTATAGANGEDGGDAINLQFDMTLINDGEIYAGGGGGGGGEPYAAGALLTGSGGGGGGGNSWSAASGGAAGTNSVEPAKVGQAGSNTASYLIAGNGGDGYPDEAGGGAGGGSGASITKAIYSGADGDATGFLESGAGGGGGCGYPGATGGDGSTSASGPNPGAGTGGATGKAIEPNGNTLTLANNGSIYGATS